MHFLGKPYVVIEPDELKQAKFANNSMFLKGEQVEGLIRAKFLAPKTMFPFLLIRHEKKSFAVCCHTCLLKKNYDICRHNEEERSFIDSYTIQEVAFAVNTCGYKVIQIYELLCYE